MLFNSVFTIFWDFNIQCRVCYTACSVNRRETVSLFKFPIKSLMIPFELNWPVSLITIYILYVIITTDTAVNTHPDQWAAIYAAAPGELLGVRWLAQGHLVVVLKVERALYIHSPHLQFLQARDSNSQPFDYESETLTIIGLNFPFIELVNNNPTAYWLRLIGMHNAKTWFLKMVKIWVICFCKWTLHIYIYI